MTLGTSVKHNKQCDYHSSDLEAFLKINHRSFKAETIQCGCLHWLKCSWDHEAQHTLQDGGSKFDPRTKETHVKEITASDGL